MINVAKVHLMADEEDRGKITTRQDTGWLIILRDGTPIGRLKIDEHDCVDAEEARKLLRRTTTGSS